MNCLDYRRALAAGGGESAAMSEHRAGCPACAAHHADCADFEAVLRRALEVPVPGELAGRVLDRGERLRRGGRRRFLAAAGLAAAAAGAGLYAYLARNEPLALACIRWVMMEEAKSLMMGAMPRDEAARALADTVPLERLERIGQVRHVGPCPFNGATAYHVILVVPQDKVTLLVMPGTRLAETPSASYEGFYARVVPVGRGSVGIVGGTRDVVTRVAGVLRG